jgi:hypothetical protein
VTTETVDSKVDALVARVAEQGTEIAQMRRALLSLGSALMAGGPPGPVGYVAWHANEMKPPAEPVASSPPPVSSEPAAVAA